MASEDEDRARVDRIVALHASSEAEDVISDTHRWQGWSAGAICVDCDVDGDDPASWQKPCPGPKEQV